MAIALTTVTVLLHFRRVDGGPDLPPPEESFM
jgi:hypothetical protein